MKWDMFFRSEKGEWRSLWPELHYSAMESTSSSSSSSPIPESGVCVRARISPSQNRHRVCVFGFVAFFFFFFVACIPAAASSRSSWAQISYAQHCNSVVPESVSTEQLPGYGAGFLHMGSGYSTGGGSILGQAPVFEGDSPSFVVFRHGALYRTRTEGVIKVQGNLVFRGSRFITPLGNITRRRLLRLRINQPRIPIRRSFATFELSGFWSSDSGKLCMVGSGSSHSKEGNSRIFNVVFKLDFAKNSSIVHSLVHGTLESVDTEDSFNFFKPVSILGVSQMGYEYTLIDKEIESGFLGEYANDEDSSLSLDVGGRFGLCSVGRFSGGFELEYESDCSTVNCNLLGGTPGFLPKFMSFDQVECQDHGKMHMLLRFSDSSSQLFRTFIPNTTLVAEGAWNNKKNRLYVVACRILNFTNSLADAFVGDCSIRLSLRFPATISLKNRSTIVGKIWSNGTVNDSGYFGRIVFRDSGTAPISLPGLKYEYAETDSVSKACAQKKGVKHRGKTYPDGFSLDMRFDMSIRNNKGEQVGWGRAFPIFVDDKFMGDQLYGKFRPHSLRSGGSEALVSTSHNSLVNISYKLSFTPSPKFKLADKISSSRVAEISAEGIYDKESGVLCMVGCWRLQSNKSSNKNNSLDCEILVNVQFSPLNAAGRRVKGTVESTRAKLDQLYFQPLELSSMSIYASQATESIWRMDLEITLVLISNTFACVFVGLQLFYVKRHPDILPLISVVMLIVLTLSHMIPLLLNFEALFVTNHNRQSVFLGSGGWLEVNEVVVRVVTMVAFLLQFRLLQLTWSSRSNNGNGNGNGLWVSEKKVLYLLLPFYAGGALIAWFVHNWNNSYQTPSLRTRLAPVNYNQQHSVWGDLKSYAGLILDGFLLPQIMFNLFFNSKEKALASPFYWGTTVVRLLPHAYDLFRAHSSTWKFDLSYIYANPRMDLYSTAWDLIIPCGGMLFAVLIYLQQRFGGHCILPKRLRENSVYEKVPVDLNDQL